MYLRRTIENDVVGERNLIPDNEKHEILRVEKERREKLWAYEPGVEIPKVSI